MKILLNLSNRKDDRSPKTKGFRAMQLKLCALLVLAAACVVRGAEPLVLFDFEEGLQNQGSLGGVGRFSTYVAGEEPALDRGILGNCLDLTAASRHGGTTNVTTGGAMVYRHAMLDQLETYTVTVWHRQNPLMQGINARLLVKRDAFDLLPQARGVSLGLGPGTQKVMYTLSGPVRETLAGEWRFSAVVVEQERIRAYVGGMAGNLVPCSERARQEHTVQGAGDLVLGTLGGIRPFNGWLDNVRVFDEPLDEAELRALLAADLATATLVRPISVLELTRPPAGTHRFQFRRSDIPFSTRWQHRKEAPAVMQSFHATQCLWVYGSDPTIIQQIKALGIGYQGTLNGLQGTDQALPSRSAAGDLSGRHEDLDGNKNMPSWMVTFQPPHYTGCCNHPAFREIFFQEAKELVERGADMLHVDDWAMNASWVLHGGVCFCEHCRRGFREWLAKRFSAEELRERFAIDNVAAFDYREHLRSHGVPDAAVYRAEFHNLPLTPQFVDFQVASMRGFFLDFRARLDQWSPDRYIPVTVNSLLDRLNPNHNLCGVDLMDGFVGESSLDANQQTATNYVFAAKAAEAFGIAQVVSPIPHSTARTRAALATTYALGQTHLVPWDIYMGSDAAGSQPRYFGTREQYGDLYDFIHEHAHLLDTYQSVAEIGVLANADLLGHDHALPRFCQRLAEQQIPFHLLLATSKHARLPIRPADLRAVRLVVQFSPTESFCEEDQKTIREASESGLTRFVPPTADLQAICRLRNLRLLQVEGPEAIYAFPRANPARRASVIHLVNWHLEAASERAATFQHVTLTLLAPVRWGPLTSVTYHQPNQEPVVLQPERHLDCLRITLPSLETWGLVELHVSDETNSHYEQ